MTMPMTTPTAPYDYRTARHASPQGDSGAGRDRRGVGREIVPGLVDGTIREGQGANTWDRLTSHERMPWFNVPYMIGQADTRVDWTRCAPVRVSLHMRQSTVRKLVGTDNTRNLDPHPITTFGTQDQGHGIHSNPQGYKWTANQNFRARQQQTPARVNRLSPARYTGQSYSQTTVIQP